MKKLLLAILLCTSAAIAPLANAGLLLFDIDADPGAWTAAIAGLTAVTAYDFNSDANYGIQSFDSPLTSAGGGPVSAGNLAPIVSMHEVGNASSGAGQLVGVGGGLFANPENAVLANFFLDGFAIDFSSPVLAFAFNALNLESGSSGVIDILAYDDIGGSTLFQDISVNEGSGKNLGILATGGMFLSGIEIQDVLGDGAEGVQGDGTYYLQRDGQIPAPPTLGLLGLALLGLGWGTRRKT